MIVTLNQKFQSNRYTTETLAYFPVDTWIWLWTHHQHEVYILLWKLEFLSWYSLRPVWIHKVPCRYVLCWFHGRVCLCLWCTRHHCFCNTYAPLFENIAWDTRTLPDLPGWISCEDWFWSCNDCFWSFLHQCVINLISIHSIVTRNPKKWLSGSLMKVFRFVGVPNGWSLP